MATYEKNTLIQTQTGTDREIHYPVSKGKNILLSDELSTALGVNTEDATVEDGMLVLYNLLTSLQSTIQSIDSKIGDSDDA